MSRVSRRSAALLLSAPAILSAPVLAGGRARAQGRNWRPASQVRIVVPAAPGGTTDIMARLCAQHLQARWGVPVAVENRSGAGGTIGTLDVVRAAPDGLTLLSGNIGPQAIAYSLFRNLPYREDQITPVSGQIRGPNVLVVNAATPVQDHGGVRGLAAQGAGARHLRLHRRRAVHAPLAGVDAATAERAGDPRALPRLRAGADGAAGEPCRLPGGQPDRRDRAGPRGQAARAGGDERRAQRASCRTCRRCANPCRSWRVSR